MSESKNKETLFSFMQYVRAEDAFVIVCLDIETYAAFVNIPYFH